MHAQQKTTLIEMPEWMKKVIDFFTCYWKTNKYARVFFSLAQFEMSKRTKFITNLQTEKWE